VGLWRLILEGLAVLIGRCVFRLPFGQPPVCTGDLPFGLAFRSISDFHRRSIFRRCLPTQPPTLIGCQILRAGPSVDLQLSPSTSLLGPTFRSTFDLRLRSTFRLRLCIDLRLAPPADPPACLPANLQLSLSTNLPAPPLYRPATFAACRSSGLPSD